MNATLDESVLEEISDDSDKFIQFTVINTNARSLCPKINSLIDCCDEMKADIAIVTETWLADGEGLEEDQEDLVHCAGIGMLYKNRAPNTSGAGTWGCRGVLQEEQGGTESFQDAQSG